MPVTYLDFEQPLAALDARVAALRSGEVRGPAAARELRQLAAARRRLEREVYESLSAWQRVQLARHVDRPQTLDYVGRLCREFFELRGDRAFADDPAIVAGVGLCHGQPLAVVGHQRGHGTAERVRRNFGMANPEGHRKAIRAFRLAERLGMPVLTLVDTQGAYPGVGAEERGQAEAIAHTMRTMTELRVPIVSVVIGEGGSGGALALAVADRVLMMQYACYSVISPEGCAAILYRDRDPAHVARAAAALKLTAGDLLRAGAIDALVPEPAGGAHRNPRRALEAVERAVLHALAELRRISPLVLRRRRYEKFRRLGAHVDGGSAASRAAAPGARARRRRAIAKPKAVR
ncbi:MAG: acetyl-CoA carboxylase carboxyl transferase subunit alpha [Polyangiaceae bacterium UTPRO1]|nr:acetyl-CoA carboxylase carboxyltransferase subunit alpha [Myxococcales bacterium]OQY68873.1 MAG: acetyl-CoA carboxylase carboxyl transferase subunit alpha [Polyangiaceae bacterium UTPRO1]